MPTATPPPDSAETAAHARQWVADYRARAPAHDILHQADPAPWTAMFEELAAVASDDLGHARERVQRHATDIGTGFRVHGESDERPWPVSPVPLLIDAQEWAGIAAGIRQRAELLERVTADLYGPATLVANGTIPAALVTGSPLFLRPMVGLDPPGGRHLQFVGIDLVRGPTGEWRVLADHLRAPIGAGYALENRLAVARTLGGLQAKLNVQRHAPFFAAFRAGLAALCRRADPRIGLLTPGRYNPSYPEQAHLARYLGLLLVEGADLAALEGRVYVRTVAGLKRIDALWRRLDPRLLDPLAFDTRSQIGVPGLIDAYAAGEVVLANAPGAGVLESPAFAAFMPTLAHAVLGEPLLLPTIATWWCGGAGERAHVEANLDRLTIAPAFAHLPAGLADHASRADLLADLARRPQDYVGQEEVRLSTMPVVVGDRLEPRPFTLRVFAARDADGAWVVLPGGFGRIGEHPHATAAAIGEGLWSADVCIHGTEAVAPVSLLTAPDSLHVRRNPGTLPSRVADNFYWLGRYLERGEALLASIRVLLGNSIDADVGAVLPPATLGKLVGLIAGTGAAPHPGSMSRPALTAFARTAMEEPGGASVAAINRHARDLGQVSRDRLSADMVRLLAAPFPSQIGMLERAGTLQRRYAAIAGLCAEHMVRNTAWRFHDLGRRVERAVAMTRAIRLFGLAAPGDAKDGAGANPDDLSTLLDLADSQISYRQRYPTGIARVAVVDLVALDPHNPRSLAFQTEAIATHLARLPVLEDDDMAEPQQMQATRLHALLATATAAALDGDTLGDVERRLVALSDALARRYFLQGAEPLREAGLTLA